MEELMMKSYVKDYPRPQHVRDNWENLNGIWDFSFDDDNCGEALKWYHTFPKDKKINVPFTYETKLSGVSEEEGHDNIWYRKTVTVSEENWKDNKLLLHFEGSDFVTKVWVNGQMAGSHKGGYARFSFDITTLIKVGENEIVVKAEDSYDIAQPRGKQRWTKDNFACWYVQTTGIWKTVWMEYVSKINLSSMKITPVLSEQSVDIEFEIESDVIDQDLCVEVIVTFGDTFINRTVVSVPSKHSLTKLNIFKKEFTDHNGIKTWSPEEPNLYDLEVRVLYQNKVCDTIKSYFGMREIRIDKSNILLNGHPLYQKLILDQGYWQDSHLTPPSEEALIEDIDKIMKLGYNGLRKHQKTEDERFLYWCDVKGMLVWSESAAAYQFSDYAVEEFTKEWMEIVRQNYNHPSIITWTPFNESWGIANVEVNKPQQNFTEAIYHLTKSFDNNRPVIVNDGWEHTISDIITLHDYEEVGKIFRDRYITCKDQIFTTEVYHSGWKSAFADGYSYKGQPVIISEFGGIAFNNDDSGWGYGNKVTNEDDFLRRFDDITTAIKEIPYVCGYCYTQVTDVQQEINGLMDINRNFKVSPEKISEINSRKVGYLLV